MKHLSETRTEDTILDLLKIQGWPIERHPKGTLVRQNEYKNLRAIAEMFKGKSKTGSGDAFPDFLLIDPNTAWPVMVIEAKANSADIYKAIDEAKWYAKACIDAGYNTIAVGVAGQEKTQINIEVQKFVSGDWRPIHYRDSPISWIPTYRDIQNLIASNELIDLFPVIPNLEVLAEKADLINRILREAAIKDEYRPAYVGAIILALWQTKGRIRKEPEFVLDDINQACEAAFAKAQKIELGKSLRIDSANKKLANTCWEILATLEKLNVVTALFDHDYLGQLYETFFRYTGGNTIGQYFTPRHITQMMADICQVTSQDIVIDPACGTGGFLISIIKRVCETENAKYEDVVALVRDNLIGYESEPLTAALCVVNMILRGDGKSGIRNEDVFRAKDFPTEQCNIALMNPPFPHAKTDVPPQRFVEKALLSLSKRGKLAVILPTSLIVKREYAQWRKKILSENSLIAVCELPDEVFQPFASTTTSVIVLEKGVPHHRHVKSVFIRVAYDGLNLKKGTRVPRRDGKNQIDDTINSVINKTSKDGFSGVTAIERGAEWAPGAYIPSGTPTEDELQTSIDELLRRYVSFYTRYAPQIAKQRKLIESGEIDAQDYRTIVSEKRLKNAKSLSTEPETIGCYFDILYGQKELHSRDGIPPGDSLIISPTEQYNGTYGWLKFPTLLKAPFVTVAQTGSIGEAFVQSEPCGVNDDCLVLLPKEKEFPLACLFIAAAIIRLEKWRFSYGRKLTPSRISDYKMKRMPSIEEWATSEIEKWYKITEAAINVYSEQE